jgi:WD40 repeat protein
VSFTPDGHTLIAGGGSAATTSLWDLTDLTHPNRLATLTGQTGTVTSAALSPDGRTLAVGSTDHTVLIWDVAVPSLPLRIATVKAGTLGAALALNPDGHTLVTGTGGTVTLWDYPKLNAIRADATSQACAMAGRGLTAAEWARYVPELSYQRTCQ